VTSPIEAFRGNLAVMVGGHAHLKSTGGGLTGMAVFVCECAISPCSPLPCPSIRNGNIYQEGTPQAEEWEREHAPRKPV
jgi:hypothetical protein